MSRIKNCLAAGVLLIIICVFLSAGADTVTFGSVAVDEQTEYVDMGDEAVTDVDGFITFLSTLPNLKAVDLFATPLQPKRAEALHARFPNVAFGMTLQLQEHRVRTDATAFSTLHTPSSPMHTNDDLACLRFCKGLRALDLGHNLITNLSFLYDLPELRVLIVAMNRVTDLTPIASLQHLEYLEVFNNSITDISCLAALPCLMDLNLVSNQIQDLSPVLEVKTLKRLWMRAYRPGLSYAETNETAQHIREALPGCEVDETSLGIDGTWREHPHYEVIHRVFQTGVYESFADSWPTPS
ncbi:MAG: leucine-rich repeat domain-containing protein, partial [Clostridia bacterium]|nr:leucine-rich repeat domain-containing protein [Clostridia bacterium]